MVDSRIDDPSYQVHLRRAVAHQLVDDLLKSDYIAFERGPDKLHSLRYPMVATLGVVSKGQVATIEARIAERQPQFARAVAEEAVRQIHNWGSYYDRVVIRKDDAARMVFDALKMVTEKWSKAWAIAQKDRG